MKIKDDIIPVGNLILQYYGSNIYWKFLNESTSITKATLVRSINLKYSAESNCLCFDFRHFDGPYKLAISMDSKKVLLEVNNQYIPNRSRYDRLYELEVVNYENSTYLIGKFSLLRGVGLNEMDLEHFHFTAIFNGHNDSDLILDINKSFSESNYFYSGSLAINRKEF